MKYFLGPFIALIGSVLVGLLLASSGSVSVSVSVSALEVAAASENRLHTPKAGSASRSW